MPNIHMDITKRILIELENGTRPWEQPWSLTPGLNIPANAVTDRPYSGINKILLWHIRRAYPLPRFLTYKQAEAASGNVRKGEHGHHVVFFKIVDKGEGSGDSDEQHSYRMLKSYTVFNIAQCEGLPAKFTTPPPAPNRDQRDRELEEFVTLTGAIVKESDYSPDASSNGLARYAPSHDWILMPPFSSFNGSTDFYAVLFHELIHWTGHSSRLDRQLNKRFDDPDEARAAEELVAELGAAFLCAEFSIDGKVPQAASYIDGYLKLLNTDPRAFITCCAQFQTAVDFLRQILLSDSATPPTEQAAA
jgi:antirestriction protein ArdC